MASKSRSRYADYAVYVVVRTLICILRIVPAQVALAFAAFMGWLAHRIDKRHRAVAAENLRHAFPDHSDAEIDRLVRASFRQLFVVGVETAILMHRLRPSNVHRHVADQDADKRRFVWELVRSGQPLIVMTGHVGNWEVLSLALGMEGGKASVIARPLDNPFVDRYLRRLRMATGQRIIDKDGASHEAADVLAAGHALGLVGDQDAGPKGLFVPFFGRLASTYKSIALLSLEFQAPIIVLGCVRSGQPLHYLLFLEDAIFPREYARDPSAVRAITERYTAALERIGRRYPEQYFWLHRRWKSQPRQRQLKAAA